MSKSMRWPLISLVGQAPVCQALEKFRGNLCHRDAQGRSFCTPRMYICLLRAILPWCPCLHSFFLLLFLPPQFYVQLNRILHLHCWGALAKSYSMCAVLCSHWGMFENTTLQTWCVPSTSLKISFSCSVWGEKSWCTTLKFTSTEAPSNWLETKNLWEIYRATGTRLFFSANLFCKGFAVKETWGKPHSDLDRSRTFPHVHILLSLSLIKNQYMAQSQLL